MAAITPPNLTPAPTPVPQRNDRVTFSDRVDTFITWLITAVTEFGAVANNVYVNTADAYTSAGTATTKAALTAADAIQTASDRVAADASATMAVNAAASISSQVSVPIHDATSKTTPVDADEIGLVDSAASNVLKKLTWANLKATLATWINGGTLAGSFTTLNATVAGATLVQNLQGSAGVYSRLGTESSSLYIVHNGTNDTYIYTAEAADLRFGTNSTERLKISATGDVTVSTPALLGYGTGAGGTVTQATSKATTVTLNKPCGQINMHNASLAAGQSVMFALNNTSISGYPDNLLVTPVALFSYRAEVAQLSPGVATIRVTNVTAGALSEAFSINFAIIKGATA